MPRQLTPPTNFPPIRLLLSQAAKLSAAISFLTLFSAVGMAQMTEDTASDLYTVTAVTDGDTVSVARNDERLIVQLACIDAPELTQLQGQASANKLASLASGQVRLNIVGADQYGRTLAEVYNPDDGFINLQMVESGDAVVYPREIGNCGDNADLLLAAEEKAKVARVGVWGDPTFVMPWDYRQSFRTPTVAPRRLRPRADWRNL